MLTTGILISGKTSVGVRKMTIGPRIRISRASTVKVYGRRRANLTIHMMLSSYELTAKPRRAEVPSTVPITHSCSTLQTLPRRDTATALPVGDDDVQYAIR